MDSPFSLPPGLGSGGGDSDCHWTVQAGKPISAIQWASCQTSWTASLLNSLPVILMVNRM
jgi:hypothetical protein